MFTVTYPSTLLVSFGNIFGSRRWQVAARPRVGDRPVRKSMVACCVDLIAGHLNGNRGRMFPLSWRFMNRKQEVEGEVP